MNEPDQIRWGVLGTAKIATKVAKAIREAPGAELAAVASRSGPRAESWAAQHGAGRAYGSYDELLADPELTAVYIPLPPSLHAEWTIRAAQAGKHVLCEKPLAASASEGREMIAACREHRVQLMDGTMWMHHPRTELMQAELTSGKLGPLRRVSAAFSANFLADAPPDNIRFQRELAGGALGDVGWYCVRAALWAFGELPERVQATARFFQEVDIDLSAWLWFREDRMAVFDCGFDTVWRKWFEVAGSLGSLVCDDFVNPWKTERPRFWLHDGQGQSTEHVAPPQIQEVRMIEHFGELVRKIIRDGAAPDDRWPRQSLETQVVCDALAESARREMPIEIDADSVA
jgi:predicted dehydrogenase